MIRNDKGSRLRIALPMLTHKPRALSFDSLSDETALANGFAPQQLPHQRFVDGGLNVEVEALDGLWCGQPVTLGPADSRQRGLAV